MPPRRASTTAPRRRSRAGARPSASATAIPPHDAIRLIGRAGLGALRVPVADGGAGRSLRELFDVVIRLAEADSNVAQSLRAHFHFVEGAAARPPTRRERARWLPEVVARPTLRQRDGRAHDARHVRLRDDARPRPSGDGLRPARARSTTRPAASTPTASSVAAVLPGGETSPAIVPADRAGVVLEDDWDGMGQRLTASGTSRFEDVHVARRRGAAEPDRLADSPAPRCGVPAALPRRGRWPAIARDAAADAAALVRGRTPHVQPRLRRAARPTTRSLQQVVGQIDADAFAAEAVVLAAADALDAARGERAATPTRCTRRRCGPRSAQVVVVRAGAARGRAAVRRRRRVGDRPRRATSTATGATPARSPRTTRRCTRRGRSATCASTAAAAGQRLLLARRCGCTPG